MTNQNQRLTFADDMGLRALIKSVDLPETGRVTLRDARQAGLYLRIYPGGRMTWGIEKRIKDGPKRAFTLGDYPDAVSLKDARAEAKIIAAEASQGIDRVADAARAKEEAKAEAARAAAEAASRVSVADVFVLYDKLHLTAKLRSADDRRRQLTAALADLMNTAYCDLDRATLQAIVDAKAETGAAIMANRLAAGLRAFTGWAWRRGYSETDIGAGLIKPAKERARDVVLSINEVRAVWAATHDMGNLWGPLFRLLIITGQRRGDITGLLWAEVKPDRLEISGERTKNGQPHIVHLPDAALVEFSMLPREHGLVFTTTGITPVSGFSRAKSRLDALLGENFPDWRLHDLRTAMASALADAGEREDVIDRILNHVASGSAVSGVSRVYNRAKLLPQRAVALDRWARMITDTGGEVVALSGAGARG